MRIRTLKSGNLLRLLLIGFLLSLATISLCQGVSNALGPTGSQDFEYSGAHLLLEKNDPYLAWAHGDRNGFLLAQSPNYIPTLLYLLRPIARLDWPLAKLAWATVNLLLSLLFAYYLFHAQSEPDRWFPGLAIALLFLSSMPVRNGIGNGQQSMLVLVSTFIALKTINRATVAGFFMSISMAKYSLGTYFLATLLGLKKLKLALICLVFIGASYLMVSIETGTSFDFDLLVSPLRVTETGMATYPTTLPGLIRLSLGHPGVLALAAIGVIITFVSTPSFVGKNSRARNDLLGAATIATLCSLLFAPHAVYDFVFLALPLALGLRIHSLSMLARILYVATLVCYWNLTRLIDTLHSMFMSNFVYSLLTASLATLSLLFLSGRAWCAENGK